MKKSLLLTALLFTGLILFCVLAHHQRPILVSVVEGAYPPPSPGSSGLFAAYPVPPTPVVDDGDSKEAELALEYLTSTYDLKKDTLKILRKSAANFDLIEDNILSFKIADLTGDFDIYMIYVDTNTGEIFENIEYLRALNDQLVKEKFGKLSPILFSRIQTIKETEVIPVTIWVLAKEGESLPELELAAKEAILSRHPDLFSKDADLGKVFDVEDTETAKQLEEEYNKIINDEMVLRTTPMLLKLQASGYDAKVLTGIPMIFANLTKDQVLTVNKLNIVLI